MGTSGVIMGERDIPLLRRKLPPPPSIASMSKSKNKQFSEYSRFLPLHQHFDHPTPPRKAIRCAMELIRSNIRPLLG